MINVDKRYTMKTIGILHNIIRSRRWNRLPLALSFIIFHLSFSPSPCVAQIKIAGNVYGGGNAGNMTGNTSVTIHAGDLNHVYGGARVANVGGSAFVHVDGKHASDYIIINKVFGGNDISGTVGKNAEGKQLPGKLTDDGTNVLTHTTENNIDNTWDAAVRISTKTTTTEGVTTEAADAQKVYIGQLFGGGNGDYTYSTETSEVPEDPEAPDGPMTTVTTYTATTPTGEVAVSSLTPLSAPELSKAYLEICGGSIVYAYGGGNNATVTNEAVVCVDNPSTVVNSITDAGGTELLTNDRLKTGMGINLGFSYPTSDAFQIGRLFGGNNKAAMAIMPKWNLKSGSIRNLYSGGNEGKMTSPTGILLEIAATSKIKVDNVYGGCRKANVEPCTAGTTTLVDHVYSPDGYKFPTDLAARVLIRGGDINNVYGGNDVSGRVYFGNAVGIYASIRGDVYGGGNGSYPYTDNAKLKDDETYSDLYYDVNALLGQTAGSTFNDLQSAEALNLFRPNAEQVSLRVAGTDPANPVIIGGGIFVGGNSATLKKREGAATPMVELKIGSNVLADKVFLGNNGANMVKTDDTAGEHFDGVLRMMNSKELTSDHSKFNSMNLLDPEVMAKYMEGCAMDIIPKVVFDNSEIDPADYYDYSTTFGSFYCGGNVGSMTADGLTTIDFTHKIIIFDKIVGGCNNAIVKSTEYNAEYVGGLIGVPDDDGNKLVLNLGGPKIQPKRWAVERDASYAKVLDANGQPTYLLTSGTHPHRYLEWNTVDSREYDTATKTYKEMAPVTTGTGESSADDLARRLYGGNVYGGCCESGIVNGNVVINLNASLVERDVLFDEVESDELGEEVSLYGSTQTEQTNYNILKRRTGVILGQQGMDVFGSALNVFGGGKGKDTEIWGSTVINLNRGYTFQIFGGSEEGVIGKSKTPSTANDYIYDTDGKYAFNGRQYEYNPAYSCYVNLCGTKAGVSKAADSSEDMAECEFMYGGGFFGPIAGNTVVNLGKGRIFNSFAGSCNGDILGTSETFIGRQVKAEYRSTTPENVVNQDRFEPGFPWVRDNVYGGNDLGGRILGVNDYSSHVRGKRSWDTAYPFAVYAKVHPTDADSNGTPDVLQASAYVEYLQGRVDAIFGGHYGTYDYKDKKFERYTDTATGEPLTFAGSTDAIFYKPRLDNAFVNFRPTYYNDNNVVKRVFGACQGESGEKDRDLLQNRSYVLIDIPQISDEESTENFNKYSTMEVFGAGAWGGVGMKYSYAESSAAGFNLDKASAIVDLVRGEIGAAYGASYEEGVTRRSVVNVPQGSTIRIGSIFGGGYGMDTYKPCDVYEAHVEYHSENAVLVNNRPRTDETGQKLGNPLMLGAIYGGNNNQRRTLYSFINIDVPVRQSHYKYGMTTGTVYGAGYGSRTWNEYTEVNLLSGASVYEVYGGGEAGGVMSAESTQAYIAANPESKAADVWTAAWTLGSGYDPAGGFSNYASNDYASNKATNLSNPITRTAEMDDRDTKTYKYNTNVIINEGAYVGNYAYAGGYGTADKFAGSGDIYGSTYLALLGGTVNKDIYAACTSGSVYDLFRAKNIFPNFKATTNVYVKGGTVRNVYGGGWRGSVGYHNGEISDVANNSSDKDGEAHIVIGDRDGSSHTNGIPSVTRNVYGGGEGGAIYGGAYVTLNKGYIGYRYNGEATDDAATTDFDERYVAELDDATPGDNLLDKGGNIFGGGYVANSYVDSTHVTMYDGTVRGGLYGGGEIGPIGRGTVHKDTLALSKVSTYIMHNHDGSAQPAAIFKGGQTNVYLYGGHVMRDVFGGGRGYDNWGGEGFFQSQEEKDNMDRSSKGYVFGSTAVHIYGGEIGTEEGVLHGYGNVFGGGNEGFVYSATGKKVGTDRSDDHLTNGIPTDGGGFYYQDGDKSKPLTTDCYVEVAPRCKVLSGTLTFTANAEKGVKASYGTGDYVPVAALNQLQNWNYDDETWAQLDTRGVTIHNAIFAGGNITEGSDKLFANTTTVYGNAAASLRDVYNVDLISLGTEDMGGLYGDGNLTLVDGFRELHIDNYGTDYYSLNETMALADYYNLSKRQQAYYKLKYISTKDHVYEYYECKTQYNESNGETYKKGQKITEAQYNALSNKAYWVQGTKSYKQDDQIEENEYALMDGTDETPKTGEKANWTLFGVTSIYAGRPMNTIQRANMCGVFGSRMVLKGAQDRVPETVDYNNYTINRVDEVSLNKRTSEAGDDAVHGNYFGIYNVVNYLGNLTSDVFFDDVRKTDTNIDANKADGTTTYYDWKALRPQGKNRNNGISTNKVALASGVYLEIKREEGEKTGTDDWGYITGVVELDLINVMQGMGGGYVYARNEHGVKTWHGGENGWGKVTMLDENTEARTYRRFEYTSPSATSSLQPIQTSGNFVHNTKQIVDDCYPNTGIYKDGYVKSPAHYWYIRGYIYVYDQYISAYTGAANAYAERVELPLTISAAANGRMTLRDVQPNYYAYYDKNGNKIGDESVNADDHITVNNITYHLNDPVSSWEYRLMSDGDKARFVEETYVVVDDCTVGGKSYAKGDVMTAEEYHTLRGTGTTGPAVTYDEGGKEKTDGDFNYFFRMSNNLSHDTGYLLTYDVNNPMPWNNYYTKTDAPHNQAERLNIEDYGKLTSGQNDYTEGPTFTPTNSGVYGQYEIKQGNIVYGATKSNYDTNVSGHLGANPLTQATVTERAYIVTKEYSVKDANDQEVQHLNPGTPIYKSKYSDTQWAAITAAGAAGVAKVCTKLLEFSSSDYVYADQLLSSADYNALKEKVIANVSSVTTDAQAETYLNDYIDDAYICTAGGMYGGTYFVTSQAYRAIDTWCAMSEADRANFKFNYDALDLLIDPTYGGDYGYKPQYDGYAPGTTETTIKAVEEGTGSASVLHPGSTPLNPTIYSKTQAIDYQAECTEAVSYTDESGETVSYEPNSAESAWLTRTQYEDIPNEKHHYAPITVTKPGNYYMVNTAFMRGDVPYTIGQQIDEETYLSMTDAQKTNIDVLHFTSDHTTPKTGSSTDYETLYYYYCREDYTIGEKGEGKRVTTMGIKAGSEASTYIDGQPVPKGVIISKENYDALTNKQKGFTIHGTAPTEVSTLYVSSNSDINDLSKEKIITVVYLYEYEESDESGQNVTPVSERHIVNIHINFKSGVPEIGEVNPPALVLPGTMLGLNIPTVSQGAYTITESGWEIFANDGDADSHFNGEEYRNNEDPVYWYQNGYRIAYYAKTRLGKTYSNSVPVRVGNYHDLKKVMDDKQHHYYIDHEDADYEPKIYINDYSGSGQNGLSLFRDLMNLTHGKTVDGHEPLKLNNPGKEIKNAQFLEFFLRADQQAPAVPSGSPAGTAAWTPIASGENECFSGVFHGDGHTISGLDHSLFDKLCGDVYNLGVTGSFTQAGVANMGEGYVENCWVKSTATDPGAGTIDHALLPAGATKPYAVFGNPSASDKKQVVNCYFWDGNKALYTVQGGSAALTSGDAHGTARAMTAQEFYNGTVAYNLNGFYLYKRYSDQQSGTAGTAYKYYTVEAGGTLSAPQTKYYASNPASCSSGYTPSSPSANYKAPKYVEDRFRDGDFRYAGGTIPESDNERLYTWQENETEHSAYYPIWPDDYLFFGQALNYGHMDGKNGRDLREHQPLPSAINRSNERVMTTAEGNRVYRAPAYFRSSEMGVAHFNPYAVFAATQKDDPSVIAYKGMTAIDFTGYNDVNYDYQKGWSQWSQTSQKSQNDGKTAKAYAFYPPLLDDDGLQEMYNADLTRNLLAYTMTTTPAATQTNGVVSAYLQDEPYNETDSKYHTVDVYDSHADVVRGHWVQKQGEGNFVARNDHMLVDRQDFNAPIAYNFTTGKRMWYQRKPDNYVTTTLSGSPAVRTTSGWEGVSLPFKAEIVTTDKKGEITHFYGGSWESKNDTHSKIGHEYWLREFAAMTEPDGSAVGTATATMNYPAASSADGVKENTNTFLWDYYYSYNNYNDLNGDDYQEDDAHHDYYKSARKYADYPRLAAATPYIIGFPGATYYEFDLSGGFEAVTAQATQPIKLEAQTITFASATGAAIKVSDDETTGVEKGNYTFKPSYLNETFAAGTTGTYTLAADGGSYDMIPAAAAAGEPAVADTKVAAFRPYFLKSSSSSRQLTRSIVFNGTASELGAAPDKQADDTGALSISAARHKIIVSSSLRHAADVRIVSPSGITMAAFTIAPGETVETRVNLGGVYIVQTADSQYNKKITVR